MTMHVQEQEIKQYRGVAEIFFFEGKDGYGGNKFSNDFYIGNQAVLEILEEQENQVVELIVELT
ncbi:hypothetical protein ACQKMD_00800 [Viridibacillus sp. NPDC096237]|uniref:hypothetical protein n=1 Tax=Viridibacillus sp. NPDC096237 TaxID=3390721 RepID=UPI003CFBD4A6